MLVVAIAMMSSCQCHMALQPVVVINSTRRSIDAGVTPLARSLVSMARWRSEKSSAKTVTRWASAVSVGAVVDVGSQRHDAVLDEVDGDVGRSAQAAGEFEHAVDLGRVERIAGLDEHIACGRCHGILPAVMFGVVRRFGDSTDRRVP